MSYSSLVWAWVLPPLIVVIVLAALYLSYGKGKSTELINAEYEHWKDWARALLTVMTVLLAFDGSLLGDASNKYVVLTGGVIGFMGVFLVAGWFTREGFWQFKNKPVLLRCGSVLFGIQAFLFLLAFVIRQLS
jgi:hypothetical protein